MARRALPPAETGLAGLEEVQPTLYGPRALGARRYRRRAVQWTTAIDDPSMRLPPGRKFVPSTSRVVPEASPTAAPAARAARAARVAGGGGGRGVLRGLGGLGRGLGVVGAAWGAFDLARAVGAFGPEELADEKRVARALAGLEQGVGFTAGTERRGVERQIESMEALAAAREMGRELELAGLVAGRESMLAQVASRYTPPIESLLVQRGLI